jgi:hypothetical protein
MFGSNDSRPWRPGAFLFLRGQVFTSRKRKRRDRASRRSRFRLVTNHASVRKDGKAPAHRLQGSSIITGGMKLAKLSIPVFSIFFSRQTTSQL